MLKNKNILDIENVS